MMVGLETIAACVNYIECLNNNMIGFMFLSGNLQDSVV